MYEQSTFQLACTYSLGNSLPNIIYILVAGGALTVVAGMVIRAAAPALGSADSGPVGAERPS